jgi:hypothetical protein
MDRPIPRRLHSCNYAGPTALQRLNLSLRPPCPVKASRQLIPIPHLTLLRLYASELSRCMSAYGAIWTRCLRRCGSRRRALPA